MISNHVLDLFFIISTIIFLSAAVIVKNDDGSLKNKIINRIAIACILAMIAYMGIISISFDLGLCENPSRAHPYFVSGRLISGILIPYAILYLQGLKNFLSMIHISKAKFYILFSLILLITINEYFIHIPVYESKFNIFHF